MESVKRYILSQIAAKAISKEEAALLLEEMIIEKRRILATEKEDIAIIGMACDFPTANTPSQYWEMLLEERDIITEFPVSRQRDVNDFVSQKIEKGTKYISYLLGGYFERIDTFDNEFFKIAPSDAKTMDPQQRLFLQTVWHAIEDACLDSHCLGRQNVGLYVAHTECEYKELLSYTDPMAIVGTMPAMIAGRTAYVLDIHGPVQTIDTTCSSSLVAVHNACMALKYGECDIAIAGGVKLMLFPVNVDSYGMRIESKSNKCKAFSDNADGIVNGEGSGVVVLKKLSAAERDNDHIYAVIKSGAVNSDGRSNGIASPNAKAQAEVLQMAWERAGINPEQLGLIEAHGTGTRLGDPIEIEGITQALKKYTEQTSFCAVGSVKSNIGHTDAAAGIAGLIKAALSLYHKTIPATLHVDRENSLIPFAASPVYVSKKAEPWRADTHPRYAGVSSFGISGTNCHIVLQEYINNAFSDKSIRPRLLTLSAHTASALTGLIDTVIKYLELTEQDLANICYTQNCFRKLYSYRLAVIADTKEEMADLLRSFQLSKNIASEDTNKINTILYNQGILPSSIIKEKQLAEDFVYNGNVDWQEYYTGCSYAKIPIWNYTFLPTRHWAVKASTLLPEVDTGLMNWLHTVSWEAKALNRERPEFYNAACLVFCDRMGIGKTITEHFQESILVYWGERYQKISDYEYVVRSTAEIDYEELLKGIPAFLLRRIKTVIHLWACDIPVLNMETTGISLSLSCNSLFLFLKNAASRFTVQTDIWLVTDSNNTNMASQTLWGMCSVVSQEYPLLSCACIEINSLYGIEFCANAVLENLFQEKGQQDYYISYTDKIRKIKYINKYIPEMQRQPYALPVKKNEIYLITGGAGILGLQICKQIAKKENVIFALVNRTKLPEREMWQITSQSTDCTEFLRYQTQTFLEIEQMGSRVLLFSADASVEEDMFSIIENLRAKGQIKGVIQAIKDIHEKPLAELELFEFNQSIEKRIKATLLLMQLLNWDELDFMVILSSISSIIGGIGRGDCAAANAFLDAYGKEANKRKGKIHVLNLPGITKERLPKEQQEFAAFPGMSIRDFEMAFAYLLSSKSGFVLIEDFDLVEVKKMQPFIKIQFGKNLYIQQEKQTDGGIQQDGIKLPESLQDTEKTMLKIWQSVVGTEQIELTDDFFAIGGDSLMAIKLFDQIKNIIGIELDVTTIFSYPTIDAISAHVYEILSASETPKIENNRLEDVLDQMEGGKLSVEQAHKLVQEMLD